MRIKRKAVKEAPAVACALPGQLGFHPSESENWDHSCLRSIKHWLVHRLATASHCIGQIRVQIASTISRRSRMRGAPVLISFSELGNTCHLENVRKSERIVLAQQTARKARSLFPSVTSYVEFRNVKNWSNGSISSAETTLNIPVRSFRLLRVLR